MTRGRLFQLSAALLLGASLSACSYFSWVPGLGKKVPPLPPLTSNSLSLAWSASVGKSAGYLFVPSVNDRLVYASSYDGTIAALAEDGGGIVKRIDAHARISGGVGAGDNFVAVSSVKGEILAFDAAGRSLWQGSVGGEVLAPPAVTLTSVVVRTADGRIVALNRADGKRRWVFQRPAPALTLRTNAGVLVNRNNLYAGYPGGKMVAIELESGKPIWEATLSQARGATELERIADVSGLPVLDESRICAAVYQGRTGCLETLSGNLLWTREIASSESVAVDGKNLYVVETGGNVYALDKTSGSTVWKQEKLAAQDPVAPLVLKGRVLIGDIHGVIHALSPENGDLVGRQATDGSRIITLLASGDRAIAQTERGGIFAISVK